MTFASPYPEVDIPETGVYDYLFGDLTEADADRVAMVDAPTGAELTYRDLVTRIDAFAGALADRGIGVGDVVGLLAPNSSGFAVAFHGILRAGATATTVNALFTAKDIAKQLTDAHAKMLITVSALLPQAAEGAQRAGLSPGEIVVLDGSGEAQEGSGGHPSA
ncbi:AMP-binding protein, partial [Mycolicibacterium murale]